MELKEPGIFLFMAMCNPNVKAIDVEKEILNVIKDIQNGKINQKDLDKIKINTKSWGNKEGMRSRGSSRGSQLRLSYCCF